MGVHFTDEITSNSSHTANGSARTVLVARVATAMALTRGCIALVPTIRAKGVATTRSASTLTAGTVFAGYTSGRMLAGVNDLAELFQSPGVTVNSESCSPLVWP